MRRPCSFAHFHDDSRIMRVPKQALHDLIPSVHLPELPHDTRQNDHQERHSSDNSARNDTIINRHKNDLFDCENDMI